MSDPYKNKAFKETPYAKKTEITGQLVVVLRGKLDDRGLQLIHPISRAVKSGEVHELILTDEKNSAPGKEVNSISYLGFVEIKNPGVILTGDTVTINDKEIGVIAGFDETHMPNHLNIVIRSDSRKSGEQMGLGLNDQISIIM